MALIFLCWSSGLLCDLLWSDPDKDTNGWGENDRGVSFTFGADVVSKFLNRHDLDLICRAHQVVCNTKLSMIVLILWSTYMYAQCFGSWERISQLRAGDALTFEEMHTLYASGREICIQKFRPSFQHKQDWHCQCTHAPVWWLIRKNIFNEWFAFALSDRFDREDFFTCFPSKWQHWCDAYRFHD